MKKVLKQVVLTMMVLLLALGAVAPAALATEAQMESNAAVVLSIYSGCQGTLYITISGVKQNPGLFKWSSSNSNVAVVNSNGVVTGRKSGYATIYAKRKSNGATFSGVVKVKRNKVDNLTSRRSATAAPYQKVSFGLKSVEITSPNTVAVEYYLYCNFPRNWQLKKITAVQDAINLFNRSTGKLVKTIVGDAYQLKTTKISGFRPHRGQSVQVIKATFSGSRVSSGGINLNQYHIRNSGNATVSYTYAR